MTLSQFRDISNIIDMVLHWCKKLRNKDCRDGKSHLNLQRVQTNETLYNSIICLSTTIFIILEYESQTLFLTFIYVDRGYKSSNIFP
jgi:hypothetical protein